MTTSTSLKIEQCTVLGSAGYPLIAGDAIELHFNHSSVAVSNPEGPEFEIPYLELAEISITGPGGVKSGGGFVGGGFGVEGAVQGMAVALVLNTLTTKTKIHTFISLITNVGELHLHYSQLEPSALRIGLAEVFTKLRRLDAAWTQSRLGVLQVRHDAKEISDEMYDSLKKRLLTDPILPEPAQRNGRCPSCKATIPLIASECPKCHALFGVGSAWKVRPI